jgi:two-component system OmpR family response regulator
MAMDGHLILILEGDSDYRLNLSTYLRGQGLTARTAETLGDVINHDYNQGWAIVLANLGANTSDGLQFLRTSALQRCCPIIVLSDNDDHIDRIVCLEMGADDYIVKTAHYREILARIRVAWRRATSPALPYNSVAAPRVATPTARWCFSRETKDLVAPGGRRIDLTADQFSLLDTLIQNAGKALSRPYLSRELFGRPLKPGDRSIDNLVVRLRRRLGDPARAPHVVKTARMGGYLFERFPEPQGMKPAVRQQEERRAA